jgi:hypothetical protein
LTDRPADSGGHYAPALAGLVMAEKNKKRSIELRQGPDEKRPGTHRFGVRSVGVINGLVDITVQGPEYPRFAVNNTYGIQAYSPEIASAALEAVGPCNDAVAECRRRAQAAGPDGAFASDPGTLEACGQAFEICWGGVYFPYEIYSGVGISVFLGMYVRRLKTDTFRQRNPFDIAHRKADPFPYMYSIGYLNQPEVQDALGAKVNYTEANANVANSEWRR